MHGFSKVISLSQLSPIHTYSRCTSRAAAEHPEMRVDSARAHFRAYESEPFAVRPPRFAARPRRSVAQHRAPPLSLPSERSGSAPSGSMSILMTRMSSRVLSRLRRSAAYRAVLYRSWSLADSSSVSKKDSIRPSHPQLGCRAAKSSWLAAELVLVALPRCRRAARSVADPRRAPATSRAPPRPLQTTR
jgi:hypothetical protein